jgi:hypothetical protein
MPTTFHSQHLLTCLKDLYQLLSAFAFGATVKGKAQPNI